MNLLRFKNILSVAFVVCSVICILLWLDAFHKYEYRTFCSPSGKFCITVVKCSEINFVDPITKKYVLFGKEKNRRPFSGQYIEFPEETNLVIIWEEEELLKIVSSQPPINKVDRLKNIKVEIIASYEKHDYFAKKYPDYSL